MLLAVSVLLGEMTSALAAKDPAYFTQVTIAFVIAFVLGVPLLSGKTYVQAALSLYWRRWLLHQFCGDYFRRQTYYHLMFQPEIDNPDQRLTEDITTFTQQAVNLWVIAIESVLQLLGFAGILWASSPLLMGVLLLYAVVGTGLAIARFGPVFVGINLEQLQREADFRFGLVQIRENAEMIAFYDGQTTEFQRMQARFTAVFQTVAHLIRWQFGLNLFQNTYQYLTFLLPLAVLAPPIIAGTLKVGVFDQAVIAFRSTLIALALIISQFEKLSEFASSITRLQTLEQAMHPATVSAATITTTFSNQLELANLTVQTPTGQPLIQDLSLILEPHQSLLIMGASGVGKTSLLRTIAGLWHQGSGKISRPEREQLLFLPQRPYMILGSLRQQLLYPRSSSDIPDSQLLEILKRVNLADLADRVGGLDALADWAQILSLGEQQRLAFARLFLAQPTYAILDESTNALDTANEAELYQQLRSSGIGYVSVGHRAELQAFHQQVLTIVPDRTWSLTSLSA